MPASTLTQLSAGLPQRNSYWYHKLFIGRENDGSIRDALPDGGPTQGVEQPFISVYQTEYSDKKNLENFRVTEPCPVDVKVSMSPSNGGPSWPHAFTGSFCFLENAPVVHSKGISCWDEIRMVLDSIPFLVFRSHCVIRGVTQRSALLSSVHGGLYFVILFKSSLVKL